MYVLYVVTMYVPVSMHMQYTWQKPAPGVFCNHSLPHLLKQGLPLTWTLLTRLNLASQIDIFLFLSPQWNYSLLKITPSAGVPLKNIRGEPLRPQLSIPGHVQAW